MNRSQNRTVDLVYIHFKPVNINGKSYLVSTKDTAVIVFIIGRTIYHKHVM